MSTLVIKNLPEDLHAKLRAQAERNHRSVTKEVVRLIEIGVNAPPAKAAQIAAPASGGGGLTIEEIEAAIADGRFARYRSLDEVNSWMDELRQDRDVAP